jgi:hypothetical protein
MNKMSLKSIENIADITDPDTHIHLERLKANLNELNFRIDAELSKVGYLKDAAKLR